MRKFQRTEVISTLDWNLYLHLKVFDISEHENEMRVFHTSVIHRYICNTFWLQISWYKENVAMCFEIRVRSLITC